MSQQIDELLNFAPCGFLSFTDDGLIVAVNFTLSELLAYPPDYLSGKIIDSILPIASRIFYQTHFFPLLKLHGKLEEIYFSIRSKQGSDIPMLINAARRKQGESFVNNCIFIPIRQRIQFEDEILKAKKAAETAHLAQKQAEIALRQQYDRLILLGEITQRIRQFLDLSTIFEVSVREIRQSIHADRIGIFKFDSDSNFSDGEFVSESVVEGFDSAIAIKISDHCFGGQYANSYQHGRIQVFEDIDKAELAECHRDILKRFQVRANLVFPLLEGTYLWGLLCIHQCSTPRQWQESEITFVQQIANQLAIAIKQANLVEQLQQELRDRQQAQQLLTERNQQLVFTNAELDRATRLKDEFLASMSHELRTPLNAILGMTEGLQEEVFGEINQSQSKAIQTIERSGSHLLELINDILDVAKIESGQIKLDRTPTAIAHLCQSCLAFIKQQALAKRIQLEIKLQPHLPELLVDERRIRQVLLNLLSNAVKFTPERGKITIEVRQEQQISPTIPSQDLTLGMHKFIQIAVIDTGIGIAPDDINKLFQPFIQIDSTLNRQYQGTGLGLALVKSLVEIHGGKVELTSEVGVGSCFTIYLPFTDTKNSLAVAQIPTQLISESSQPDERDIPNLVLIAEDNEANIMTISSYLNAKGYHILLAKNGQEAIAMAKTHHPDIILMDIQMPVMDGLEAIKQIRRDPSLSDIQIIALTALAMTRDRDLCIAAGANEYLSKPVKLKQLVTMIQNLLIPQGETYETS
jgi:signal transduction histidine kinase/ActR/RegA family two-component response regulator